MWFRGRTSKLFAVLIGLPFVLLGAWLWDLNRPDAVVSRAMVALKNHDYQQVSRAASRLEGYPQFRRHAHLLRGWLFLEDGNVSSALKEFSYTRPEGVLRFPALQFTAEALYRTGRIAEAAQLLTVLVNENPSSAEAHRWLGAVHYDLGNQAAAVEELTEAARLKPLDHRPHRLLGLVCEDQSLYGLAVEHYRSALKLGKDIPQPDIQADLAQLLIRRNRFAEALESLTEAKPSATVWALRADCHDGLGEQEASRDAIRHALDADPSNPRALLLYGTQQVADGNPEGAIEPLQKVLKHDPHNTKARYQLAMAYLKLGREEDGQREMDARDASTKLHEQFYALVKQAAADPSNAEIREQLAATATSLGKPELAKRWELAARVCRNAAEAGQVPEESPSVSSAEENPETDSSAQ